MLVGYKNFLNYSISEGYGKFSTKNVFYSASLYSPTSEYYLFKDIGIKEVLLPCIRSVDDKDNIYLALTDSRSITVDYKCYIKPSGLSYLIFGSLILSLLHMKYH